MPDPLTPSDLRTLAILVSDHLAECGGIDCDGRLDEVMARDKSLIKKLHALEAAAKETTDA